MYYERNSKGYKCGNLLWGVCLVLPKIDLILSNWHGDLFVLSGMAAFSQAMVQRGFTDHRLGG